MKNLNFNKLFWQNRGPYSIIDNQKASKGFTVSSTVVGTETRM